jgi:hypothetical protein
MIEWGTHLVETLEQRDSVGFLYDLRAAALDHAQQLGQLLGHRSHEIRFFGLGLAGPGPGPGLGPVPGTRFDRSGFAHSREPDQLLPAPASVDQLLQLSLGEKKLVGFLELVGLDRHPVD